MNNTELCKLIGIEPMVSYALQLNNYEDFKDICSPASEAKKVFLELFNKGYRLYERPKVKYPNLSLPNNFVKVLECISKFKMVHFSGDEVFFKRAGLCFGDEPDEINYEYCVAKGLIELIEKAIKEEFLFPLELKSIKQALQAINDWDWG